MTGEAKSCDRCGSTTGCPRDTGWPCTDEQVRDIERRAGYGSRGDYRSFWD